MHDKIYYVYILTNQANTVLYVGITGHLSRRMYQHRNKVYDGFTAKYNVNKLVYVESYRDVNIAIKREKQLKGWRREKKEQLINERNPKWDNLFNKP